MADKLNVANPDNRWNTDGTAFDFQFGAYGTHLRVWENSLEDALEIAMEWLDDNAPGMLVKIDWDAAVSDVGAPEGWRDDDEWSEKVREYAETDVTICSHTTLKNGDGILSYEWYVNEVDVPHPTFGAFENQEHARVVASAFAVAHEFDEVAVALRMANRLGHGDLIGYLDGCHIGEVTLENYFDELRYEAQSFLDSIKPEVQS